MYSLSYGVGEVEETVELCSWVHECYWMIVGHINVHYL